MLVSEAATPEGHTRAARGYPTRAASSEAMLISDVPRAFFAAQAKRKVVVKLPREALEDGDSTLSIQKSPHLDPSRLFSGARKQSSR